MLTQVIKDYLRTKDTNISQEVLSKVEAAAATTGIRLAQNISRQLLPYRKQADDGGSPKLYPSNATKCARRMAYNALDFPAEPLTVSSKLKFLIGDLVETAMLALIASAAVVVGNNAVMEIKIGGKPRRGRSDGTLVMDGKRENLEIKSMSDYAFRKFNETGPDDTWGYLGQANVYMRTKLELKEIDEPGYTRFVAINRDKGDIADHIVQYDQKYALLADMNFAHVENALKQNKLPNRPYDLQADGKLPLICSYCPMKYSCWASPGQRVSFDENVDPVHQENTTRRVVQYFEKGARGAARPAWRVIE